MKSDVEIAQETKLEHIERIAAKLGINTDDIEFYGKYKAKIDNNTIKKFQNNKKGKLVLVTAMNPTPAGEGKTTTSIGLADAFNKMGRKVALALREPSLGPCFGMKGGAAGGGFAQVAPMEDINLHFTGDFHAITTAHNLLAAVIDNHIHHGNALDIDTRRILWKHALDLNDRALRNIVVGLGGAANGVPHESGFDITVASEMMAILCLSTDLNDMEQKLSKILVAYKKDGSPVFTEDLGITGALALLFKDAIKPNLVQTLEGTPAFVHGGPFANIAHGCNSIAATKFALNVADIVVTEAGFGADLGAEKFLNIKCRKANLKPDAVVIVATVRAMKMHGGLLKNELDKVDMKALENGAENLTKHIENIKKFGLPAVVAINAFPTDTKEELEFAQNICEKAGAEVALSEVWAKGGEGGIALAKKVEAAFDKPNDFHYLYDDGKSVEEKIEIIAKEIYGADGVDFSEAAKKELKNIENLNAKNLPVCMAKTQYSLSDNPNLLGRPKGFRITVREIKLSRGAGFVVALTGSILTMPGLPKHPAAMDMSIDENGKITGLF